MKPRFRILAALLALLAFSASFAEQVWAGACAPVAEAGAHHTSPAPDADGAHHGAQSPAAPGEPRAPDDCPLRAVAPGCALLLLPAPVRVPAAPADAPRVVAVPYTDPSREILLATAFFRPPQR